MTFEPGVSTVTRAKCESISGRFVSAAHAFTAWLHSSRAAASDPASRQALDGNRHQPQILCPRC